MVLPIIFRTTAYAALLGLLQLIFLLCNYSLLPGFDAPTYLVNNARIILLGEVTLDEGGNIPTGTFLTSNEICNK